MKYSTIYKSTETLQNVLHCNVSHSVIMPPPPPTPPPPREAAVAQRARASLSSRLSSLCFTPLRPNFDPRTGIHWTTDSTILAYLLLDTRGYVFSSANFLFSFTKPNKQFFPCGYIVYMCGENRTFFCATC